MTAGDRSAMLSAPLLLAQMAARAKTPIGRVHVLTCAAMIAKLNNNLELSDDTHCRAVAAVLADAMTQTRFGKAS